MVFQWFCGKTTIGNDGFQWLCTIGPTMEWLCTIVEVEKGLRAVYPPTLWTMAKAFFLWRASRGHQQAECDLS